MSMSRHRARHIPEVLTKAQEACEASQGDELLRQVRALQSKTLSTLLRAEREGDLRLVLMAVREARGNVELLAKLLGELDERPVLNLVLSPEWVSLRGKILIALDPFPEARLALVESLNGASGE